MKNKEIELGLFDEIFEQEAIVNIQKFARIAKAEGLTVELGFSGGKDSIVCYSLCKRAGIPFTAVFHYAFESPEVVSFIKEKYPDVIIQKREKSYFQLIKKKQFLPTKDIRFCCEYFKENSKNAVIIGIRKEESAGRMKRKLFGIRKIKTLKKYAEMNVFQENCIEKGKNSPIELRPILYFSEVEVWSYIRKYNLPYPSLYDEGQRRCGCMLCPLAGLRDNMYYLKKYPNLLPSFNRNVAQKLPIDFIFNRGDNETEMKDDPYRFLLYWLSASFRPSKRGKKLADNYLKENRL
ncbi:MAG: phosphoadenosine phosphosulfate reductase family protein [Tannerella sp.]|jgi:phosphoadenosine phosphosulfate reductase|nr:phosphoadenosine phosphosulfate reductase family protein [Tannerella sp.]